MIEIIPAIDIIGGECVRLTKGDYATKKSYSTDPLSVAKSYEDIGIKRLHIVDLDGAKLSEPANLKVLEKIASQTSLDIQWGGGVKSTEALKNVYSAGANRAICGSVAITQPELFISWLEEFKPEHVILGADIKDGKIATHGWLESSQSTVYQVIDKFTPYGLSQVICTDISKDGMLQGPSFDLYEELQNKYNVINITISGGVSKMDDITKANEMNLRSIIVGKAIYEGFITLKQLEECLQNE